MSMDTDAFILVAMMTVMFVILVFFIRNISKEIDRQFVQLKLEDTKFDALIEKLEFMNSDAAKRHELVWKKIETLQIALLEKIDQLR